MPRPTDPNSERSIARRLSVELDMPVTRKCVQVWIEKGYDLDDIPKLKKKLRNQERAPKRPKGGEVVTAEVIPVQAPEVPAAEQPLEPAAVEAELAKLQAKLLSAADYEEARTYNTQIVGIRNVLKELREQGKYILRNTAMASALKAATASRAAWEKIEDELPPQLEGLTAAQMKTKLRDYARSKAIELSEVFQN